MDWKSSDEIKLDRKQLWSQREEFIDTVEQKEGLVYGVEDFWEQFSNIWTNVMSVFAH